MQTTSPKGLLAHLDDPGKRLYVALIVTFALFGAAITLVGATLPRLIRAFDWSYTASDAVLSSGALGFLLATFATGLAIHRLGSRRIMLAGLGAVVVGLALIGRHPTPALTMVAHFVIGAGVGSGEVVTNLALIRLERPGSSRLMNFAHAFFCVGGVAGPLAVGAWLGLTPGDDAPWRAVYPAMAFLSILVLVVLARSRFPEEEPAPTRGAGAATNRRSLLALFTLMLMLYVSGELGVSNWAPEYFVDVRGLSAPTGALMVSALWMGLLVGRLALSLMYTGRRQDLAIIALSLTGAAAVVALTSVSSVGLAVAAVFVAGLGFSGVYPMVMTLVGRWFGSGRAVGLASTGGGVGPFLFPYLTGYMAETWGMAAALLTCAAASALVAALGAVVTLARPRSPTAREPSHRHGDDGA